ncbi:MAG TPA: DnaD domain protein [Thermomicrobiales bacterium]|nr:DnaD domain protein [Thermomicrobiales bacterium]
MPRGSLSTPFGGFLVATDPAVAIPRAFFESVLPGIGSIEELHVSLAMFRLIDEAGGYDYPVAEHTALRDRSLRAAMKVPGSPREPDRRIAKGLELAVARGTFLRLEAGDGRRPTVWYYVNTPVNRSNVAAMERGSLAPPSTIWEDDTPPVIRVERPNAFRLYEQNIGPLTPLIADQISQAIEEYPADWIEDAIVESVAYNRRSWRYITRILESWTTSGRRDSER